MKTFYWKILLIITLCLAGFNICSAADITYYPKFRADDSNGEPMAYGQVYSYVPGTTTPKATYTSSTGDVANSNPIVLDNKGEADIYTTGPTKLVLKKKVGSVYVTQWEETVEGSGVIFGNYKYPDYEAPDQGAADATYTTVKDIIDGLAADEEATIFLPHNSGGVTTAYTFLTAETIPENVTLELEAGAILDTTGMSSGNLLINSSFKHYGNRQVFKSGTSSDISFGDDAVDYANAMWWGPPKTSGENDLFAFEAAYNAYPWVGVPFGAYYLDSPFVLTESNSGMFGLSSEIIGGGVVEIRVNTGFAGGSYNGVVEVSSQGGSNLSGITLKNFKIECGSKADYGIYFASTSTSDVVVDMVPVSGAILDAISGSVFVASFSNIRIGGGSVGGFDLGDVDGAFSNEGTAIDLTNCYVLSCSGSAYTFRGVQGWVMNGCAGDLNENILSVTAGSIGAMIGCDFESNDRIYGGSGGSSSTSIKSSRFLGYGNDTTPPSAIFSYDGYLTVEDCRFSGADAFTYFINQNAAAVYLKESGNNIDFLTQENSLQTGVENVTPDLIPLAYFYLSGATTISRGVPTTIPFDAELFAIDNSGITGTYQFETPITGFYTVRASATIDALQDGQYITVKVTDGSENIILTSDTYNNSGGALSATSQGETLRKITKGTLLSATVEYTDGSTDRNMNANRSRTFFSVEYIGSPI